MVKDERIQMSIRIIPFDGKQSSWRMWSYKFLAVAMRKGYKHILVESRSTVRRSARLGTGDEEDQEKIDNLNYIAFNYLY